jgi:hypothetical protein
MPNDEFMVGVVGQGADHPQNEHQAKACRRARLTPWIVFLLAVLGSGWIYIACIREESSPDHPCGVVLVVDWCRFACGRSDEVAEGESKSNGGIPS